mgnify:CR=1 FL=1
MATRKLTGAELDVARKLEEAEIIERAQMILNPDEEEDSKVIHIRAQERVEKATGSVPAPARGIGYVLDKIPPGQRVWVVLILALVFVALAGGSGWLASVKGWLKF